MRACQVNITTTADGKESRFSCKGTLEAENRSIRLRYADENGETELLSDGVTVTIARQGAYSMRLVLRKGDMCVGKLGISGSEGVVQTQTNRIAYSVKESGVTMALHYALLFGLERQIMKIKIVAKYDKDGEKE